MKLMSHEEWRAFLLSSPRTAKAATVRPDGRPHIAPVWFDLDDDDVIFTTWHTTVKARDLQRDPRISLCVDAAHNTICDGDADTVQDDRVEPTRSRTTWRMGVTSAAWCPAVRIRGSSP